jgi:hypothetical protein
MDAKVARTGIENHDLHAEGSTDLTLGGEMHPTLVHVEFTKREETSSTPAFFPSLKLRPQETKPWR